jgi:hypothetical protein
VKPRFESLNRVHPERTAEESLAEVEVEATEPHPAKTSIRSGGSQTYLIPRWITWLQADSGADLKKEHPIVGCSFIACESFRDYSSV